MVKEFSVSCNLFCLKTQNPELTCQILSIELEWLFIYFKWEIVVRENVEAGSRVDTYMTILLTFLNHPDIF